MVLLLVIGDVDERIVTVSKLESIESDQNRRLFGQLTMKTWKAGLSAESPTLVVDALAGFGLQNENKQSGMQEP